MLVGAAGMRIEFPHGVADQYFAVALECQMPVEIAGHPNMMRNNNAIAEGGVASMSEACVNNRLMPSVTTSVLSLNPVPDGPAIGRMQVGRDVAFLVKAFFGAGVL